MLVGGGLEEAGMVCSARGLVCGLHGSMGRRDRRWEVGEEDPGEEIRKRERPRAQTLRTRPPQARQSSFL